MPYSLSSSRNSPGPLPSSFSQIPRTETYNGYLAASIAKSFVLNHSIDYAKNSAPTCPNPSVTSNTIPGVSKLDWLKGRSKCNQLIGDILYLSGYEMPMFQINKNSYHYMNAERLPTQKGYFTRINSRSDIRLGDLVVWDNPARQGENGAHVEIITTLDHSRNTLRTTGAHNDGAYEKDNSYILGSLNINRDIFVLRPTKKQ